MPLYVSSALEAIELRRSNEYSFWGNRGAVNRVEPIASPHFNLEVALEPGEKIFTVGSCFARNVEAKLAVAGFSLPMRGLMAHRSFTGVDARTLNNFSTPSIWNELSWAVGESAYDERSIVEYANGKWIDLHVIGNIKPAPRETVLRRRAAIVEAYRSFMDCKLIIITLGLIEVWFDHETGQYINSVPPPPLVRRQPERFELHVLDYAETFDYCDRAVRLLREHGREDATILMSVSPVALGVTYRPEDVMSANCYSKSVQRAVTEQIVARYPNVEYFPSYESVTLSDRQRAWTGDFTHVTEEMIAHNVDRLVRQLTVDARKDDSLDQARADIEAGGAGAAYLRAMEMRKADPAKARIFFEAFGDWSLQSSMFATEHVEWLLSQRECLKALEVAAQSNTVSERMTLAQVRALLMLNRASEALAMLDTPLFEQSRSNKYWSIRVEAQGKTGDVAGLEASLSGWCRALPKKSAVARTHVARAMLGQSTIARAVELLNLALVDEPELVLAQILLAEAHLALGDTEQARRAFDRIDPKTPSETRRYNQLKDRIGERLAA